MRLLLVCGGAPPSRCAAANQRMLGSEGDGGVLIFLTEADGRRTIVLLGGGTEVRELPD